jgi:hypothetical protein
VVGRLGVDGELQPGERLPDVGLRRRGVRDDGVALAREALVELHHRTPDARALLLQVGQGLLDVVLVAKILEALGQRHVGLQELRRLPDLVPVVRQLGSSR